MLTLTVAVTGSDVESRRRRSAYSTRSPEKVSATSDWSSEERGI